MAWRKHTDVLMLPPSLLAEEVTEHDIAPLNGFGECSVRIDLLQGAFYGGAKLRVPVRGELFECPGRIAALGFGEDHVEPECAHAVLLEQAIDQVREDRARPWPLTDLREAIFVGRSRCGRRACVAALV